MDDASQESYALTLEEWRASMDASIRRENGWLALAGLFWLHEGENTFGSAETNDIILPEASPPRLGTFDLQRGQVRLRIHNDDGQLLDLKPAFGGLLAPDSSGDPSRIQLGPLTMVVIQRGERRGVRLWDNSRLARQEYPGRVWFPVDASWRLQSSFEPHSPPLALEIPNVLGDSTEEAGAGTITFERDGRLHSLEALQTGSGGLWLIFADRTNGIHTYPAGRFLLCPPAEHGRVEVDFNRAYNPPCAFTDFATCPLPPPQNHLDVLVEAGEGYRPLMDPSG